MSVINDCIKFDSNGIYNPSKLFQTNDSIKFFPITYWPFIILNFYEPVICGAWIPLLNTLAKRLNKRIEYLQLPRVLGDDKARHYMLMQNPDIILAMQGVSNLIFYNDKIKAFGKVVPFTKFIGFDDNSNIAYRIYPGDLQTLSFFNRFDLDFSLILILFLFILSIILSKFRNFYHFFYHILNNIFNLLTSLFSTNQPKIEKDNRVCCMLLIGSWLFSGIFISIEFRNYILDDMVKAIPHRVVDSWNDLSERRDIVEIIAMESDSILKFIKTENNEMAMNLKKKTLTPFSISDLWNISFHEHLYEGLTSGRSAYIYNRFFLIFYLYNFQERIISDFYENIHGYFLDKIHISKFSGLHEPYFMSVPTTDNSLLPELNKIIGIVRESGIYNQWIRNQLAQGNISKSLREEAQSLLGFDPLLIIQTQDIFYLLISGIFLSTFVYLFEKFYFGENL